MDSLQTSVGVTLAILLILAILVLGVLAWRRQRSEKDAKPDAQAQRLNGGSGGPPEPP